MAEYYKLIDAMNTPKSFNLPYRKDNKVVYKRYTLYPGTKYSGHIEDDLFVETLKNAHDKISYSKEREEALKGCGAKYEVVTCKACGGRVKKLDVWFVEVV